MVPTLLDRSKDQKFQRRKERRVEKRKSKESRNLISSEKIRGKSISISLTCEANRNKKKENTS